jgi:hypothetical protein
MEYNTKYNTAYNTEQVLVARAIKDYFAAKDEMKDAEAFLKSVKAHHLLKEVSSIKKPAVVKKATPKKK